MVRQQSSPSQATARNRNGRIGKLADRTHALGLHLLPPGGVAVEQAQLLLGLLVVGHLVLVLAALLGEGAGAVVDPLVAVDLDLLVARGGARDQAHAVHVGACGRGRRRRCDDAVDARLSGREEGSR